MGYPGGSNLKLTVVSAYSHVLCVTLGHKAVVYKCTAHNCAIYVPKKKKKRKTISKSGGGPQLSYTEQQASQGTGSPVLLCCGILGIHTGVPPLPSPPPPLTTRNAPTLTTVSPCSNTYNKPPQPTPPTRASHRTQRGCQEAESMMGGGSVLPRTTVSQKLLEADAQALTIELKIG